MGLANGPNYEPCWDHITSRTMSLGGNFYAIVNVDDYYSG